MKEKINMKIESLRIQVNSWRAKKKNAENGSVTMHHIDSEIDKLCSQIRILEWAFNL